VIAVAPLLAPTPSISTVWPVWKLFGVIDVIVTVVPDSLALRRRRRSRVDPCWMMLLSLARRHSIG